MGLAQSQEDTARRTPKYLKKTFSQCIFIHQKSHIGWPGIETGSQRRWANDMDQCLLENNDKYEKHRLGLGRLGRRFFPTYSAKEFKNGNKIWCLIFLH
jgi:hypothetical protein